MAAIANLTQSYTIKTEFPMLSMMRHSSPGGKIPAEARFCFINAAGLDFWGSFAKFVSHT